MSDELKAAREAGARALMEEIGDEGTCRAIARTVLDAFLSELSLTHVVVPREPTEAMIEVARAYLGFSPNERKGDAQALRLSMWRQMIAVAEAEAKRAASRSEASGRGE